MELLSVALVLALAGAALLWRIRHEEYCHMCPHCIRLAGDAAEKKRLAKIESTRQYHLSFHRMYGVKMGDAEHCPTCAKERP